jgi:hypothetical protein
MKAFFLFLGLVVFMHADAQVWQWSTAVESVMSAETNGHPQAYLWIPEDCKHVRAVVFAQHNMIEEGMLEHTQFRKTMSELGIAEVWVSPGINMSFDFTKDAGEDFTFMMNKLADVSGYKELASVPVIPLGHSAFATFPWNFAAWNPDRTLAVVSIHGDAPQTNLTGYGQKNVDWGNKNINGVPSLFIMGEYEWWEDRIAPAFNYITKHPKSAISLFCDAGHGHFDYSDEMIAYVCLFIKKAAQKRMPKVTPVNKSNVLVPIDRQKGWLMDRWRKDSLPIAKAAPYFLYKGDRQFASWVFDKEMADATEMFYIKSRGKRRQYIGFKQNGTVLQPDRSHANYNLKFKPLSDGISFHLSAFFSDTTGIKTATEFSTTALKIDRICGPVKKINDTTFQIRFNRLGFNNTKRSFDIWLLANNNSDINFKSGVQQLNMKIPPINNEGVEQSLRFDSIANQHEDVKSIKLYAESSAKLKVHFFVKEGPAYINDNTMQFSAIPPRTKFPVKVTVVAWQYGIAGKTKTASPITRTFYISK